MKKLLEIKQNMYLLKIYQINYQKKVEVVSTKGLAKDLLNKYTILNGAKCFSSGIVQNYSAFISTKNVLGFLLAQLKLIFGNIVEFQKKLLKI